MKQLLSTFILCCLLSRALSQEVGFTMSRGRKENTYINFDILATNVNAELSQEVGAFRCTDPGLYFFTFTALSPRKDILKVSLRKNRIPITTLFASEGSHSSVTGSMVLWLQPNDIVYPFVEDGEIYESTANTRALTSFSGFKISSSPSVGKRKNPPQDALFRDGDIDSNLPKPDTEDHIDELFKPDRRHEKPTTATTKTQAARKL